jgi:outer membrane protein assembly factor BamE (lipoprotein component of BamABCDE complex)
VAPAPTAFELVNNPHRLPSAAGNRMVLRAQSSRIGQPLKCLRRCLLRHRLSTIQGSLIISIENPMSAFHPIAEIYRVYYTSSMRRYLILASFLVFGCYPSDTFDSNRWKNADPATRERVKMLEPLLDQHPLKGMTRSQVVDLLGEPTPTDKWADWDIVYVLGPTEYTPIDHEWLVIRLDEDERVQDYGVTAD